MLAQCHNGEYLNFASLQEVDLILDSVVSGINLINIVNSPDNRISPLQPLNHSIDHCHTCGVSYCN